MRRILVAGLLGIILTGFTVGVPLLTSEAHASSRSLTLYNTHTKEKATIVYKRNGKFDADGLRKMNRFLRDWRRNESTKMDPALFDLIWQVVQKTGAKKPIHVVSGYRSPATNNMLRRRSRGVAKKSRHMRGQAMDFYLPGVSLAKIRKAGLRMQSGGVGYYPRSGSPFVHIDTGNVRHWPRMTRKQLVRVFPDGKTVHVPSDGKPLRGYKQAKVQVARHKAEMIREAKNATRFTRIAKAAPSSPTRTLPLASKSASTTAESPTLLSRLLNRTPKERPKPAFAAAQTPAAPEPQPETGSAFPVQLATLPRSPENRPAPAAFLPEQPLQVAEAADEMPTDQQGADLVAATAALDAAEDSPEPFVLAALPRVRPDLLPQSGFQLASADPASEPRTLEQLAAEQDLTNGAAEQPDDDTVTGTTITNDGVEVASNGELGATASAAPEDGRFVLASLPMARDALPGNAPSQPDETAAQQESAEEVLSRMAAQTNGPAEAKESNRFAYASADKTFLAALPTTAPRRPAQKADRTQMASLSSTIDDVSQANASTLSTLPRADTRQKQRPSAIKHRIEQGHDQLAKLTFSYGPASMSHFVHMNQSTKTATFAHLSRPIPNNLRALVSKPESMINQTFGAGSGAWAEDIHFAGPAIARMAVRRFN
ncbi:Uncharacterized conserved protein YcbK, DUF882 family [Cohaesibacter sp. ES.047]|uniref:DUF882 domain-containing protein n=1 Tax=Cohaesibacter sp. ES.047 TaxID=1798205 RepID=UPI000BB776B8|nr:DUF882 domain-containing protein [Cohaesibacter sp. ES.047]SNY90933.1 Uncharacterized conserved protein YcbK, DUF882 family [Cohaesibacter sp. ES.047]